MTEKENEVINYLNFEQYNDGNWKLSLKNSSMTMESKGRVKNNFYVYCFKNFILQLDIDKKIKFPLIIQSFLFIKERKLKHFWKKDCYAQNRISVLEDFTDLQYFFNAIYDENSSYTVFKMSDITINSLKKIEDGNENGKGRGRIRR